MLRDNYVLQHVDSDSSECDEESSGMYLVLFAVRAKHPSVE
jgi:hypothetical protein